MINSVGFEDGWREVDEVRAPRLEEKVPLSQDGELGRLPDENLKPAIVFIQSSR